MEQAFDKYSELDQILKFSTPKVLRLVEILRQVRPLNFIDPRKRRDKGENSEANKGESRSDGVDALRVNSGVGNRIGVSINSEENVEEEESVITLDQVSSDAAENMKTTPYPVHKYNVPAIESTERVVGLGVQASSHGDVCVSEEIPCDSVIECPAENVVKGSRIVNEVPNEVIPKSCSKGAQLNDCVLKEDICISSGLSSSSTCNSSVSKEETHEGVNVCGQLECEDECDKVIENLSDISAGCTMEAVSKSHSRNLEHCTESIEDSTTKGFSEDGNTVSVKDIDDSALTDGGLCMEGMEKTVQTHPDTQSSCNFEHTNNKIDSGSVVKQDLCRINIRESSHKDGCDSENHLSCDVHNGILSAKSELQDPAKVHNIKNVALCNGFLSSDVDKDPSLRISEKNNICNQNGYGNQDESGSENEYSVAKINSGSCDSVQNQHNMEDCPNGVSIADTNAPQTTSSLPCKANSDVIHINSSTVCNTELNGKTKSTPDDPLVSSKECDEYSLSSQEITSKSNNISTMSPLSGTCLQSCKESEENNATSSVGVSCEAAAMADTLAQLLPAGGKGRKRRDEVKEKVKVHNPEDPDSVCGLIFVQHRNTAKIIYRLLKVSMA